MSEAQAAYGGDNIMPIVAQYKIDKMGETWFLWEGKNVVKTGSLDTVLSEIKRREGDG